MIEEREIRDIVETWEIRKRENANSGVGGKMGQKELNTFIEVMNVQSRRLMRLLDFPEGDGAEPLWASLAELANNAAAISVRAKTFADGQDKTHLGM